MNTYHQESQNMAVQSRSDDDKKKEKKMDTPKSEKNDFNFGSSLPRNKKSKVLKIRGDVILRQTTVSTFEY